MDINFNINTDLVLPESVQSKLNYVFNKVGRLSMRALELQTTEIGNVRFTFRHSALGDVLTDDERFQQTCFVTRYETLPVLNVIDIEHHNGKFYFKNFKFMRQLLNEYRTIILNEKDSIYYKKIHHFCFKSMSNSDPKQGLSIQVRNEDNEDTTSSFLKFMGDQNKSIKFILDNCEFDYIYNGILQHSDHRFTNRYWDDYYSGKINYIFLEHCLVMTLIKGFLRCYYLIMNSLTFPVMGSL